MDNCGMVMDFEETAFGRNKYRKNKGGRHSPYNDNNNKMETRAVI